MFYSLAQLAGLFTAPALAVAGAICVAIPVAIHLLSRSRRKREDWGAMRFLRLAFKKQQRRLRLEKWLLLLTRCALVVLAGLALAGPLLSEGWGALVPGAGGGKVVHVVVEDGLSGRAVVGMALPGAGAGEGQAVRFDRLRGVALGVVDGLSPGDRVQVWHTSRPGGAVAGMNEPTADLGRAREIIENMQPGYGSSALTNVLEDVAGAIEAQGVTPESAVVAVVSDFARGSVAVDEALPAALTSLSQRARVVVTRPDVGSGNIQVQSLTPRRSLILAASGGSAGGGAGGVSVEVGLRRLGDTAGAETGEVSLMLVSPNGEARTPVMRPVNWSAGQAVATLSVDLPLASADSAGSFGAASEPGGNLPGAGAGTGVGVWSVVAEFRGQAGVADALAADNRRAAMVEVRSQLNVAVIDDADRDNASGRAAGIAGDGGGGGGGGGGEISGGAFVRAALSPEGDGRRFSVATQTLNPAAVAADRLATVDAAIVLRPEGLSAAGWSALGEFAKAGGLVWVFPPAGPGNESAGEPRGRVPGAGAGDWFGLMRSAMGVDWRLDEGAVKPGTSEGGEASRRLDAEVGPPSALLLLAADWSDLLAPVRVDRFLSVVTADPEQTWIALGDAGDATSGGGELRAFLASQRVGAGRVMLTATAVDPAWTNLPTKPLFPALLHDALRGVLGEADRGGLAAVRVGDRPRLGVAWRGVSAMSRVLWLGDVEVNDNANAADTSILLIAGADSTGDSAEESATATTRQPSSALSMPGVYGPTRSDGSTKTDAISGGPATSGGPAISGVGGGGPRVVVNVDPDAGDVRPISEAQLSGWLAGLGDWSFMDDDAPAAAWSEDPPASNLGWWLLWVLLALVVVEMGLARVFSHAGSKAENVESGKTENNGRRWARLSRAAAVLPLFIFRFFAFPLFLISPPATAGVLDDLLGLSEVQLSEATAIGWRFALPAWAWLLILIGGFGVAWWSYRRLLGPTWARVGLAGLRGLLLVLIAVLLAGPSVVRTDETVQEDVLWVLVDRSASMTVADMPPPDFPPKAPPEASSENLKIRGAGIESGLVSREEALRGALSAQAEVFGPDRLGRGRQVAWLGFGQRVTDLTPVSKTSGVESWKEPSDRATLLRSAMEEVLRRGAGRPISGVVLLSDGRTPESTGPALLAKLEQQSVRVFSVPLGAEQLPLDFSLSRLETPDTAFINDTVPVSVVVEAAGGPDDQPLDATRVTVRLIDTQTRDIIDEKQLAADQLGQPVRLRGQSSETGEMPWAVEVVYNAPANGAQELNQNNNEQAVSVVMIDRPLRVLYIEGVPRWEYRYLKNMLIRETSIDASVLLLSADAAFAQEGDTPITRLPTEEEEWRRYDVVILGDVPADRLTAEQRQQLHEQVSRRGTGLLWLAGPGSTPASYAGTMLADLLPMRDPAAVSLLPYNRLAVQPTALAQTLSVLQLQAPAPSGDNDQEPGWPLDLPSLRWVQDLGPLKPAVEVLADAINASAAGDATTPAVGISGGPLLTRLRFGAGQSLYVATDETWRWRYARGEVYFEQFWVQLVRLLGRHAATRSDEPVRLAVSTRRTPIGGTVVVELDMEDAALLARDLPSLKVAVRRQGDPSATDLAEFELRPSAPGDEPSASLKRYTSPWLANTAGALELVVVEPALAGLGLVAPLEVLADDDELRRPEADVPRLVALARATGGRVVPLDDLAQLTEPGVVRNLARKTANDVAEPLGNSALALMLIVLLLTLEWVGRKLVRLV